jgi:outer membrane biosynthesis protein TonB
MRLMREKGMTRSEAIRAFIAKPQWMEDAQQAQSGADWGSGWGKAGERQAAPTPEATPRQESILLRSPRPPYPPEALQAHIHGEVTLQIKVENGTVVDVEASGDPILANPTAEWIRSNWKFKPAVNRTFPFSVNFELH